MDDVFAFANRVQCCFLATVQGDQPRVRGFLLWRADPTGFYFHTALLKQVGRQLMANPKVEICFFDAAANNGVGLMLRVTGSAHRIQDTAMETLLFEERPFLKGLCAGADAPELLLFRIPTGEAHFWSMQDNLKENDIQRLRF